MTKHLATPASPGASFAVLTAEQLEQLLERAADRAIARMVSARLAPAKDPLADGPAVLDVKAAAKVLGVSPRTIGRMLVDGRLAAVRSGGVVRIRRAELQRWLEGDGR